MKDINYFLAVLFIIGSIMSMFPKHRKLSLEYLKYGIIGFVVFNLAPIIYSYIEKFIK